MKVDLAARVSEGPNTAVSVTLKADVAAGTAWATPVTVTVEVESKGSKVQVPPPRRPTSSRNPGAATLCQPQ